MKRILVGRGNDCDIVIPDDKDNVSRHHMIITFSLFGKMTISDTSSNGTFINGKRILKGTSIPVTENDRIRLGDNWNFDWKLVVDPYKSTRKYLFLITSLLIVAVACIFIWHTCGKTEPSEFSSIVPVQKNDIQQDGNKWNKDSTNKVAPKETSIPINSKITPKSQNVTDKKTSKKKKYSNKNNKRNSANKAYKEHSENSTVKMPLVN